MSDWIDKLRAAWRNISPREQLLVAGAGGLTAITLLVFGIITPFISAAENATSRAAAAEQQMLVMTRLRDEYAGLDARLAQVEQRIRSNREQSNLRTLLDNLAGQSSVKISSMEERQSGRNDHYAETKLEVTLKSVTLSQTVKYLHNIESSDRQLSIKSLRIKARPDKDQLLDVTFSVSSFEPTSA
jgi:type II secretory pathway component PulM